MSTSLCAAKPATPVRSKRDQDEEAAEPVRDLLTGPEKSMFKHFNIALLAEKVDEALKMSCEERLTRF